MNENPNQVATTTTTAQDVLQSSGLTARLLRRLTVSMGVIDVVKLRQAHLRLAAWEMRPAQLLDDLRTRYGISADDPETEKMPLVMEQPWMVNINSYLTNYNSFSSTTNQFISSAPTPQSLQSAAPVSSHESKSSEPLTIYSSGHAPRGAANSIRLTEDSSSPDSSSSSPQGKFRISRNPSRRAWKANPVDAPGVAQTLVPGESLASDDRNAIPSDDKTWPTLALARTRITQSQTQGERQEDEDLRVSLSVSKSSEVERKGRGLEDGEALLHARVSSRTDTITPTKESQKVSGSSKPSPTGADVLSLPVKTYVATPGSNPVRPISKTNIPPQASLAGLPTVQKQTASSQSRERPQDFIWRQSADIPLMKELRSLISQGGTEAALNPIKGSASNAQAPQSGQLTLPDEASRRDGLRVGSELTTDRILRSINRELLIERERRGY